MPPQIEIRVGVASVIQVAKCLYEDNIYVVLKYLRNALIFEDNCGAIFQEKVMLF